MKDFLKGTLFCLVLSIIAIGLSKSQGLRTTFGLDGEDITNMNLSMCNTNYAMPASCMPTNINLASFAYLGSNETFSGSVTFSQTVIGSVSGNATTANFATTAGGAPPTGAAGGSLSGTYPNPTISIAGLLPTNIAYTTSNNVFTGTQTTSNLNVGGNLVIGASTNIATFTLIFTNWLDSTTYTNNTGRNILVYQNCTLTPGALLGNAVYVMKVGGVVKSAATAPSFLTALVPSSTNQVFYLVTNGGTFTFGNAGTTGNSAAALAGGWYEVH